MYYYLLNHNLNSLYNYNVYLDIKDTLSAFKVNKLKDILNTKFGVFRNIQNIRSHESLLLQLTDLIMGAISYYHNDTQKANPAKMKLIAKIKHHSGSSLEKTNYSDKLNLFFIELSSGMPLNLIKSYNQLLDFGAYNDHQRKQSLQSVFNRDFTYNPNLSFKKRPMQPTPKNGEIPMATLYTPSYNCYYRYGNKAKNI